MSFNIEYRPENFEEVIENQDIIESLKSMLEQKSPPHTYLFHGQTGLGKTTLARIMAKELGSSGYDVIEINAANNRGIDTARDIISQMIYKPLSGENKTYILDECFAKGTKIQTDTKLKNIELIKKGDKILNLFGMDEVIEVFKNKIPLNRIIKLKINEEIIFTTKEHLFLTKNEGWKKAINLTKKDLVLKLNCSNMYNNKLQRNFKNEKNMPILSKRISNKKQKTNILFRFLQEQSKQKITKYFLSLLWKRNGCRTKGNLYSKILFSTLCRKMEKLPTLYEKNINRSRKERSKGFERMEKKKSRESKNIKSSNFNQNEEQQSNGKSKKYRKSKANKNSKGYFTCLVGRTWRKWQPNKATNNISGNVGLGDRGCNLIGKIKKRISNKLQSRHRKQRIKNCNRSRWKGSSFEKKEIKRQEKRGQIKTIRMESIEIYKRGYNDKSFKSIIGNKERDQEYIEFYDLEVKNHSSYFANNIIVHNCHAATKDFQHGILKALEDAPSHVYFILCTTEPEKLLKTIRNRCSTFEVSKLSSRGVFKLLSNVLKKVEKEIDKKYLMQISREVEGNPRQALITLQKIINVKNNDQIEKIISSIKTQEKQVIDLCRALNDQKKWEVISNIIKNIDIEPESIRRAVLGYFSAVCLSAKNKQMTLKAASILENFEDNYYDSGKAGLILSCINSIFFNES